MNIKHWLDYLWLKKYKWYRKWRGGVWYLHEFTKDAEEITFSSGVTWWARYGTINRYSYVLKSEHYYKNIKIKL